MAKPLRWNTLEQAAKWLSEKTNEEWTEDRIIDFAIEQCQPDDIINDVKYPTYLEAVLQESQVDSLSKILNSWDLTFSSIALDDQKSTDIRVFGEVELNNKKRETKLLFKENLVNLRTDKEAWIKYIGADNQSINSITEKYETPLNTTVIYCSIYWIYVRWDAPSGFPPIPPIQIDKGLIGIRDENIKQLLRDYLDCKLAEPSKKQKGKKLTEVQQDKLDCQNIAKKEWAKSPNLTKTEIINLPALAPYKNKYQGKNTLPDWLKEIDHRPMEKRLGRPHKNTRHT